MNALWLLASVAASGALVACAPREPWDPQSLGDLMPPVLSGVVALGPQTVEIRFDEPVRLVPNTLLLEPPEDAPLSISSGASILVTMREQLPGREYGVEATVEDSNGNSSCIVARFYGFNGRVPRLLINEFTTRGSGNHPDLVELKVLTDGDLAGVALLQGTDTDWIDRLVFPACDVCAGEFVVVHWKPQGIPDERDETGPRDESGGLDALDTTRDFWVPGGQGLGGNNGALALYDRPGGTLLDAVLYSDRSSDSDTAYRGFGSAAALARAQELVDQRGWTAIGGAITPEDAVNPEGSTATRSLARASSSVDTNSRGDWHVTPTRGASWGADNTDDRYEVAARRGAAGASATGGP